MNAGHQGKVQRGLALKRTFAFIFAIGLGWWLLSGAGWIWGAAVSPAEGLNIVYMRAERPPDGTELSYSGGTLQNLGVMFRSFESGWTSGNITAPGEVIYRESDGTETTVFSCFPRPSPYEGEESCTPLSVSVSPDGGTIWFDIAYGDLTVFPMADSGNGNTQLYLEDDTDPDQFITIIGTFDRVCVKSWDVATKTLNSAGSWPCTSGTWNMMPAEMPNGKVWFSSNEAGVYEHQVGGASPADSIALQPWSGNTDGTSRAILMPEERDFVMSPRLLHDGRMAYFQFGRQGTFPYRYDNGSTGGSATLPNIVWMAATNQDGSNHHTILGVHHSASVVVTHLGTNVRSPRGAGQRNNATKDILVNNYYRANNMSCGALWGFAPPDPFVEGEPPDSASPAGDRFFPTDLYTIASWAVGSDGPGDAKGTYVTGEYSHKLRDGRGLPDTSQIMVTYCRGYAHLDAPNTNKLGNAQGATAGLDLGIYMTNQIPLAIVSSGCPSSPQKDKSACERNLTKIVDEDDWQEWGAEVVAAHADIFGSSAPTTTMDTTGSSASRFIGGPVTYANSEVESVDHINDDTIEMGWTGPAGYRAHGAQGNSMAGGSVESHEDLMNSIAAICFLKENATTSSTTPNRRLGTYGSRLEYLGCVALESGDRSFQAELPADTPSLLIGVDANGYKIAGDQIAQALRTGELRKCAGCHVHSASQESFDETALDAYTNVQAISDTGNVDMMVGGSITAEDTSHRANTYVDDVLPILDSACASCHTSGGSAADLPFDLDGFGTTCSFSYYIIVWDWNQSCNGSFADWNSGATLPKPNFSKYIHSFARESYFMWYAANERLDGRSASDNTSAPSFTADTVGQDHYNLLSADQINVIKRWIDSGARYD